VTARPSFKQRTKQFLRQQTDNVLGHFDLELTHKKPQDALPLTLLAHPLDAIYQFEDIIFEVPVANVYYPYQFCYAIDAWHPFVRTLLEFAVNPALAYEDSTLYKYYQMYQPQTVRDVLLFGETSEVGEELSAYPVPQYLPTLPWDPAIETYRRGEAGLEASHGNQGFGPVSDQKGELEFRRLIDTFLSIKTHGYQPKATGDGEITGYFVRHQDDYRFIVRGGLHRAAVLGALGYEAIRVTFYNGYPRWVDTHRVNEWPLIKQGNITTETALAITERFFTDDGKEKARQIGLLDN
jgi:hypothetical protein